jgi:glycosyltransferase involved in cell wall biosynthesis
MKLSVIVPVYNEKTTILEIINAIQKSKALDFTKEIILIDDYSKDGTREILKQFTSINSELKIIYNDKNLGKGGSVRRGLEASTGDFAIIQDADLEYDPSQYAALLTPLVNGESDIVYGSRFLEIQDSKQKFRLYFLANKFLTALSNFFTGYRLTDMETCYKCFTKKALAKILPFLKAKRFEIEPEITSIASRLEMSIKEVPISYMRRTRNEGKKIGLRDGVEAIWTIVKLSL